MAEHCSRKTGKQRKKNFCCEITPLRAHRSQGFGRERSTPIPHKIHFPQERFWTNLPSSGSHPGVISRGGSKRDICAFGGHYEESISSVLRSGRNGSCQTGL